MRRLRSSVRHPAIFAKLVWTRVNEWAMGIKTEPERDGLPQRTEKDWWRGKLVAGVKHSDNFEYASLDYLNIRSVIRMLKPCEEDVFFDIGCGKGRVVCMMARERIKKCVGIELLQPLCAVAERNAKSLRGRKAPIEIMCCDATEANMNHGSIYFFFNPFGPETLRDTLQNIKRSLDACPRTARFVYYNSEFESIFHDAGWLTKTRECKSLGGLSIGFWESRPSGVENNMRVDAQSGKVVGPDDRGA